MKETEAIDLGDGRTYHLDRKTGRLTGEGYGSVVYAQTYEYAGLPTPHETPVQDTYYNPTATDKRQRW